MLTLKMIGADRAFLDEIRTSCIAPPTETIPPANPAPKIVPGKIERMPGAADGWWEVLVDIGLISMPISMLSNLIIGWFLEYTQSPELKRPTAPIRLILREGERSADLEYSGGDPGAFKTALSAALHHVHRER